MKNLSFLSLLLFVLITLNSCKGDTPQPSSQVYFSCKIDGVTFNPEYKTDFGYRSIDAKQTKWQNSTTSLLITADNGTKSVSFSVNDSEIQLNKVYYLSTNYSMSVASYRDNIFGTNSYRTDSTHIGEVVFDKRDNETITGKFFLQPMTV